MLRGRDCPLSFTGRCFTVRVAMNQTTQPAAKQQGLKQFFQRWLITTLAVALTAVILKDHIHYKGWQYLLLASLLLGIFNAFIRPIMMLMALPLLIFTLGLFMLVINASLLWLVGYLLKPNFVVDSFGWALLGSVIISIVSLALNILTGTNRARFTVRRNAPPPPKRDDGNGPVIDV
jgi:putative membrane protein